MTDELEAEIDRVGAELERVRATSRAARAGRVAELSATLRGLDTQAEVQGHKERELETRLKALRVRIDELRHALLRLE